MADRSAGDSIKESVKAELPAGCLTGPKRRQFLLRR